jgi:hypothetical protein
MTNLTSPSYFAGVLAAAAGTYVMHFANSAKEALDRLAG